MNASVVINSVDDVKNIVSISEKQPFDVDLTHGRYVIDAKSLMGIFSLDLSEPVEVAVHADEATTMNYLDSLSRSGVKVIITQ